MDLNRLTADVRPGTMLAREWNGRMQRVTVLADGFAWNGKTYPSLSKVALAITGTRWNGPRFFGLRDKSSKEARFLTPRESRQCDVRSIPASPPTRGWNRTSIPLMPSMMPLRPSIRSQAHAGWTLARSKYDDGGFSGGEWTASTRNGSCPAERYAGQWSRQHLMLGFSA